MHLADEHIAEFQMLYKKHFGKEIAKAEALEKGIRLVRLFEIVSRAVAREQRNKTLSAENLSQGSLKNTDNKNYYGHNHHQDIRTA